MGHDLSDATDLYARNAKPMLANLQRLLRIDRVYVRAEGDLLVDENGNEVLDMLGGYGSTLIGHNHPRLVDSLVAAYGRRVPTHAQGSIREPAARLGARINQEIRRGLPKAPHYYVHLSSTGTEAVEAAIKHALLEYQVRRNRWVTTIDRMCVELEERAPHDDRLQQLEEVRTTIASAQPVLFALQRGYHGKTMGALAATWNPSFRTMFEQRPLRVEFLDATDVKASDAALHEFIHVLDLPGLPSWSPIIGILFEPLQSEGGIYELPEAFVDWLKTIQLDTHLPLIADEIQSGCFRTGKFLYCEFLGLTPDYLLLGKSLGGSLGKISATCIAEHRYVPDFSWIHSSTFAEDEPSCLMALEFFDVVEAMDPPIAVRAETFERMVRLEVALIQLQVGSFIREVRGRGFLIGLDFDLAGDEVPIPVFLKTATDAGVGSYLFMSYLLGQHGIRVGVTLSKATVLRIEPSAFVTAESVLRLARALRALCEIIRDRKVTQLNAHLWSTAPDPAALEQPSTLWVRPDAGARALPRIAFLTHVIDNDNVKQMDASLASTSSGERDRFMRQFGDFADPVTYHEQVITSGEGNEIVLEIQGIMRTTPFFEASLRSGDLAALGEVRSALRLAKRNGAVLAGLGQYTSIVSSNGMLLREYGLGVTSGNSLTAAFAFRTLENALATNGRDMGDCRIGVVGVSGNICNVITQLIGDRAAGVVLVHRDDAESKRRVSASMQRIFENSTLDPSQVTLTHDRTLLADCDAIVLGTNSTDHLITPDILEYGAVLVDISVPSNVHPDVFEERPDVVAYHGALATLPGDQVLNAGWMPLPTGQIYACLAETITLGLTSHFDHYSVGVVRKAQVIDVMARAARAGVGLGMPVPLRTRTRHASLIGSS
jgi:acetylornithine/succinyldiaminopimelate/putrescine aminotransferase/predicted amino acid dehydrogenase